MLMISRRVGERIVIGGDIEVTITEIHRRTVRIAINTGKGHQVLRGEVFDSIERANRLAAESVIDEEALAPGHAGAAENPRPVAESPKPISGAVRTAADVRTALNAVTEPKGEVEPVAAAAADGGAKGEGVAR
jgi:carbon storage regulator